MRPVLGSGHPALTVHHAKEVGLGLGEHPATLFEANQPTRVPDARHVAARTVQYLFGRRAAREVRHLGPGE